MPRLEPGDGPNYVSSCENEAEVIEQQRGRRVWPRYPDGRDFGYDDLRNCTPLNYSYMDGGDYA